MIDSGRSGDDADAALDAALAAADEDMLAAIGNRLDPDVGLARILKDLGGSSAARRGLQAPEHPGKDGIIPDAAIFQDSVPPGRPQADGAGVIRSANGPDQAAEDHYLRVRQAACAAARSARAAGLTAADAESAAVAHQAAKAEHPQRPAPLPRQVTLALGTVALDGVACYFAGRALHEGQDATRAWLFTVATAGFLSLGYRALRAAETPAEWRARRQARQAAQVAATTADQDEAELDGLIDVYLGHARRLVLKAYPAGRELAVDSVIRKHPSGECPVGKEEAWRPSRTLTILYRLRAGSRSTWSRWRSSADTEAYLASDGNDV